MLQNLIEQFFREFARRAHLAPFKSDEDALQKSLPD